MKRFAFPVIALCVMLLSFTACTLSSRDDIPQGSTLINESPGKTPDLPDIQQPADPNFPADETANTRTEFRALWVATVLNLDFPSRPGISAAAMKREIEATVATTADMGLNTIILQLRPTGDALYESDIFPWSQWLSGEQGKGIPGFDPLAYWLEVCREYDIELHAWLNPYRIIHTSTNSSDPETLSADNPVRQRPELAVAWANADGRSGLFLDPGLPEARQLIIDGIVELITNYDVDGIHFDDYFYPGTNFNDEATYAKYGGDMDLGDWRRENVNELIRSIQAVIREHNDVNNKNVRWGISPTAIWKNGSDDEPLGIPTTRGQESYHAMYADTRRWVTEGWLDYICPQIYWYIGYDVADFKAISQWWSELCAESPVDLYIGHAAYREFEDNQPPFWQGEMVRQLELLSDNEAVKGSVFYRYFSLRSGVGRSIRNYYMQIDGDSFPVREPVVEINTLSIGFPVDDDTVTGTPSTVYGYNIIGTSIPGKPLFLNGEEVTTRTVEGFFHVYAPLNDGDNIFTFTQEDEEDVSRVITLKKPESSGGSTTPLPSVTKVTDLDYVTVTSDEAWLYSINSTNNAIGYMLARGQRDRITAKSGDNLVKLSCGAWIRTDAVEINREGTAVTNVLKDGVYRSGTEYDVIAWTSDIFPAVVALYDGEKLTLEFGMHTSVPGIDMPGDLSKTIFSNFRSGIRDGIPYYEFTIDEDARFEGYYVSYEDGEMRLYLKKRKSLSESTMPLTNITIILDPGHGGEFNGAVGPMGRDLPEKQLVLTNALTLAERLRELGATVILTRDTDSDITLQQRVEMSRQLKPDLFLSLHINSIAETTNAANIRGFSVWYSNNTGVPFSELTLDIMQYINPATNRQRKINHANFYVCRPWWAPHVLYEASFFSNIDDFVWLLDEREQNRMTDATVDVILEYFS